MCVCVYIYIYIYIYIALFYILYNFSDKLEDNYAFILEVL